LPDSNYLIGGNMTGKTVAQMTGLTQQRVIELTNLVENCITAETTVTDIPQLFILYATEQKLQINEILFLGMTAENILEAHRRH